MSKIYFKTNTKKEDEPQPVEEVQSTEQNGVQIAIFPNEEQVVEDPDVELTPNFNKEKIVKYFKSHPNKKYSGKVDRYSPRLNKGLSEAQVQKRFTQFLFNDTNKKYSKSYASIFIGNICTFFNLLCLIAAIALAIAGTQGLTNYLVIGITAANIVIGIFQEIRSKRSIDKLAILASATAKVIRNGELVEIPFTEIVLDDVIQLELGNQVPVDCILAEGSVEVNESLLTGESIAIKKNVGDLLYAGSFISSGSGKFRAEKIGKDTYLEKLTSKAKKYKRPNSELMNTTKFLIKCIAILIIPIAIGTFFITKTNASEIVGGWMTIVDTWKAATPNWQDVLANWSSHGHDASIINTTVGNALLELEKISYGLFSQETNYAIQRTCTVVIGMIPSGMLLLTSVALAVGVFRLSKNNTLVQDLYSLEMLARVNVLCLDKTGTITDGRMKVKDCLILNTVGDYSLNDIMGSMLAALEDNNQTSIALTNHFGHSDVLSPTAKIPFSSKRKLSAVSFEEAGTFIMGAPEFVLKPYPVKIEKIVKQYAQMGLRVIVLAHSTSQIVGDKLPTLVKPIAVISIADNIRDDAITTIDWFKENDVAVKVISGDNPVTVAEVAKRAGIQNADRFISLEGLNDSEVENIANKYTVFGRVSPEQKAILVRAMKAEGNTVAMTGDGVNDILALKESDCAISVASGSEAARNVSHLVLMDNNFNSMPKIVSEGRRVINNIKNSSSLYLMKTLFTAILAFLCIVMGRAYLFMPKNILLTEICVIGIPSFFLSLQPNNERLQGKYITYVMSRAASGAVVMILSVMSLYLVNSLFPDLFGSQEMATAVYVITFSFTGLVMLYRVCQPFNGYRVVLFLLMLGVAIVAFAVPILGDMLIDSWSTINASVTYDKVLIVLVVLEATFPVSSFMIKIMQVIMPSSVGKKTSK